jgi:hypothetical protein
MTQRALLPSDHRQTRQDMGAPEVRFARSDDVSIAFAVLGDGPFDLVFVSGCSKASGIECPDGGHPLVCRQDAVSDEHARRQRR